MDQALGPRAVNVLPLDNYILQVEFNNGEIRLFDVSPYLEKGIFSKLKNVAFFMRAHQEYGTVVWDETLDIAPETLYEKSIPINN